MRGFGNSESKPIARPKTLMCYICGREYGTKSLPIHIPACIKKWEIEENKKPPRERRPVPQPPQKLMSLLEKDSISTNEVESYNLSANEKWNDEALIRCQNCNRTFLPDRLPIHIKVCTADKPFKPLPGQQQGGSSINGGGTQAKQQPTFAKQQQTSTQQTQSIGTSYSKNSTNSTNYGGSQNIIQKGGGYQDKQNIFDSGTANLNLEQCRVCGRKFASDRIGKHMQICQKSQVNEKKRQAKIKQKQAIQEKKKSQIEKADAKYQSKLGQPKWKAQHEEFIQNLRYMKKLGKIEKAGGDIRNLPPPPQSNVPDERIECPYCGRKYAQETAARHIPKCKDIINKPKPPPSKPTMSSYQAKQYSEPVTKPQSKNIGYQNAPYSNNTQQQYGQNAQQKQQYSYNTQQPKYTSNAAQYQYDFGQDIKEASKPLNGNYNQKTNGYTTTSTITNTTNKNNTKTTTNTSQRAPSSNNTKAKQVQQQPQTNLGLGAGRVPPPKKYQLNY